MRALRFVSPFLLTLPLALPAQQVRDDLDVTSGENPTLRYGFYTEPSGQVQMGRYYFVDDGISLRVSLVPFGKTAVELPVKEYDREAGRLELGWAGRPERRCRLERNSERLFLGNCLEGEHVMPIAIRVADQYDVEWMGTYFPASETDIAIVDRARQMLVEQQGRNREGDRNCDDDAARGRVSIFCALYLASIEVAGVYRHRRPAIQQVRDVLRQRFPGEYEHMLRDINNRPDVTDEAVIESFETARKRLLTELLSTP